VPIDYEIVRRAFRSLLKDETLFPWDKVVWENRAQPTVSPSSTEIWVMEDLIPVSERLSANDTLEAVAIIQYTVGVPRATGTEKAMELATTIKAALHPGQSVSLPDGSFAAGVVIEKSEHRAGRNSWGSTSSSGYDGVWYLTSVQVTWRAFATL